MTTITQTTPSLEQMQNTKLFEQLERIFHKSNIICSLVPDPDSGQLVPAYIVDHTDIKQRYHAPNVKTREMMAELNAACSPDPDAFFIPAKGNFKGSLAIEYVNFTNPKLVKHLETIPKARELPAHHPSHRSNRETIKAADTDRGGHKR